MDRVNVSSATFSILATAINRSIVFVASSKAAFNSFTVIGASKNTFIATCLSRYFFAIESTQYCSYNQCGYTCMHCYDFTVMMKS